jgi:hypothetical protein
VVTAEDIGEKGMSKRVAAGLGLVVAGAIGCCSTPSYTPAYWNDRNDQYGNNCYNYGKQQAHRHLCTARPTLWRFSNACIVTFRGSGVRRRRKGTGVRCVLKAAL